MRSLLSTFTLSLTAAIGGAILHPVQSQTLLYTERGDTLESLGQAVSGAGDIDGDGYADFVAGAPQDRMSPAGKGYVQVFSGRTGLVIFTFDGDDDGDRFGWSVSGGRDVDGDGIPDVLVGAPGDDDMGADAGSIRLFSGKDGSVLYTIHGEEAGDSFGYALALIGDATKDGSPDLAIGAPHAGTGKLFLISGPHATVWKKLSGKTGDKLFGWSVAGLDDMDGDGAADLIVGAPSGVTPGRRNDGYATILSGKSGKEIRTFYGTVTSSSLGSSVGDARDVNADGIPDVIVGDTRLRFSGVMTGGAKVYSGKDGALIHRLGAGKSSDRYGSAVAGPGDVNGDGYADVAVGAASTTRRTLAVMFSGKDGKELYSMGARSSVNPGQAMAVAGDVDGDGAPDLVLGDRRYNLNYAGGAAFVMSTAKLGLSTDAHSVRVKTNDHCIFTLDAGSAHANKPYLLVGSYTGPTPGVNLGTVHLPLNLDTYTTYLIASPNTIIKRSRGTLDSAGTATADFKVFSAIPHAAAGLTIWHAYVVFDTSRTDFDFASNARPLTFAKRW